MFNLMHMMGDVSGEATSGAWGCPMMGGFGLGSNLMWFGGILWLATWVLVVAVLAVLLRWLWKKGGK